ncbi:EAL domain-containing protein [uncultured Xylophilus sp.]|uniref:sensor domain-containing protein n=1 Tax=uncultured Xylophilus sp. TaxID=296832 RepID=UPI0025D0660F|nr:EAL domain-containing protein [uncultured Xylophilus sp.]
MTESAVPRVGIDGLLEAVWIVDAADLRIVECNRAAQTLMGTEADTVCGRPVTDVFGAPEDRAFWAEVSAGTAGELHSDTRLSKPGGGTIAVERRVRPAGDGAPPRHWLVGAVDRSRQQASEEELETLVAELRATLESTADGILVCSLSGAIRAFNRRFAQLWDVPKELLIQRDDAAVHAQLERQVVDPEGYRARLDLLLKNSEPEATDVLLLRSGRTLQRLSTPQFSRGRVIGRVFSFRDVTDRLAAENGLRLAAKVFESSPDAVFIADAQHRIVAVNPACRRLARQEGDALVGTHAVDLFEDRDAGRLFTDIQKCWQTSGLWDGEVWHRRGDGSTCPVRLSWVVLYGTAGEMLQSIGFFRDLSAQRAAQQRIEELAYSDTLTGLPNRLLLARRVERVLQQQRGDAQQPFAILFIDLDRFKNINDSLGHQFGDRVLVHVAERVKACLRLADTLCRVGGDEFVVHLHNADALSAEHVAQRVQQALAQPFALDDLRFSVSSSIGIALHPRDGHSLDDLIRHADTAMFRVKERGRGSYRFYQPDMKVDLLSRMRMEHAMREAMDQRRFELHYQPQIELATGRLIGVEALIRWTDEAMGPVSPGVFIPLAEESGFIVTIGAWVLEEAVRQAAQWQLAGTPVRVSVNVSALQFRQADFIERVAAGIRISGLAPHLLELELTETILIQDADEVLERLHALAAIGVQLAIDDFGTGYSSLAYLKKFPIHRLKIDQSFVRGLPHDESDLAIVTAMTSMGRALRVEMVAEGVETAAQRECLRTLHCDHFQGFLCAPGLPAAEMTQRLRHEPPFMRG